MERNKPLLEIRNLVVNFYTYRGIVKAVDVDYLALYKGETLAIVGETGSGKSVMTLSILRLISNPGRIESGQINYKGEDLLKLTEENLRQLRGTAISMIFQDATSSLNPVFTVGEQITKVIEMHQKVGKEKAREKAISVLGLVRIPDPKKTLGVYPHQLSAGMRQRVMIAMALSCNPDLLIADECTSALDVTIQAQILKLIRELKARVNASVLLITHDLSVVAQNSDRVAVLYAGNVVEVARTTDIFSSPKHPYTNGLMDSIPTLGKKKQLIGIDGMVPDMIYPPQGCRFHPRCPRVMDICRTKKPKMTEADDSHVACFLYEGS